MTNKLILLAFSAMIGASAQAATLSLTSVDDIDFTNVIKAYDFTGTGNNGTFFDIGGVTFTRHNWQLSGPADGMTIVSGGHPSADNQGSGAPNITLGGTAADRANLNALLDVWNIGAGSSNGSQVNLSIALADGSYNLQFLVGKNNDRGNDYYDISAGNVGSGNEVMLGSFEVDGATDTGNLLITSTVTVTGGTLDLAIVGDNASGDARPVFSGLIISQIPEPSSAMLGVMGSLLLLRRRRE